MAFLREDALYVPQALAALSLVYLSGRGLWTLVRRGGSKTEVVNNEEEETGIALDGLKIFAFRLFRLLTVFVLLSLEIFTLTAGRNAPASLFQPGLYVYVSILAIFTVTTSARWRDAASSHLSLILFAELVVYVFLDIWPYATYYLEPLDPDHDAVTWIRIALLILSGVVVPLIMPRPFRPLTPGAKPGIEDTISLLSLYSFHYLNHIVFHANRVGNVTPDDMPELVDAEKIENINKRAMPILNPVGNKKRHVMLSTAIIWRKRLLMGMLWLFLQSLAQFAGPFGLKNLLEYLETGVSPYGLRPFVWIIVLTVGPIMAALFFTWYLYTSSTYTVEMTSAFTYLVFQHSLRIRFKSAKSPEEEEKKKDGDGTDTVATPSTIDVDSGAVSRDATEVEAESRADSDTLVGSEATPAGENQAKERAAHLTGKINNLLTSDLTIITDSFNAVAIPVACVHLFISTFYLYNLLNWSAFVGLFVMFILFPIPVYLGKLMSDVQRKKMQATDKRVQASTEYLGILRMIKLFAWESHTLKNVEKYRDLELNELKKSRFLQALLGASNEIIPIIAKVTVITLYILVSNEQFRASRIFSAIMVFTMMEERLYHIMYQLPGVIKNKVSFDRYTEFFNTTEILTDDDPATEAEQAIAAPAFEGEPPIGFKACSFSWDAFSNIPSRGKKKGNTRDSFELRFDDEISFKRGAVNLILGPTASGKTSVLMALLGEMYYKPHGVGSWHSLPREGGIAYAPQETWVLNDTIKENILFGEPYDEVRYRKALAQSALERDLSLWEAGDLTEVGEKGLTLSGGQKARVTLARALYSSASIILLDDVLAALDVHTAKWVADEALTGDLVQGRTVLLVTHNIALAAPIAQYALVLSRNGKVAMHGNVADILKSNSRLRTQLEKERLEIGGDVETKLEGTSKDEKKPDPAEEDPSKKTAGKLVVEEEKAMGRVNRAAIMLFIKAMGGPFIWAGLIGLMWFSILAWTFSNWFLGYWSSLYSVMPPNEIPTVRFLIIYVVVNLSGPVSDTLGQAFWIMRSVRATKSIHTKLLTSIFSSTFRWLDITPVGRIITRCTQDTMAVDERVSEFGLFFMFLSLNAITTYGAAVSMVGVYALIPGLTVFVLGGALGLIYLKCQVSIRREMSNAKAPVMSQVNTTLSGLPSIRAYGAQKLFDVELRKRINKYTKAALTYYHINRWISVRIDLLGAIFSGIVSSYLVYSGRLKAGFAGFTLNLVLAFTRQILVWVRIYNMLEIEANSLERMRDYLQIEHEPATSESGKPPAYWPASGDLRVEKLSARYADDSPEVLREVTFSVKSGERVGIVGRTGAGKSSVALALLRALKTSGKVYYDGLATDEINIDALRSKITLIPQQPELMHGTLRENLDPFGQHDDALLNDALRSAGLYRMKEFVEGSAEAVHEAENSLLAKNGSTSKPDNEPASGSEEIQIGLDTLVESGGTNFSLGQRQIIALARAIVRRSKLLILDEATASIDYATDVAIQKTLRTEFDRDTTIITIAHRLQTIIDYDKILVLEAGQLVEFDSPKALLGQEKGYFRSLVDESDEREILYKLAHA